MIQTSGSATRVPAPIPAPGTFAEQAMALRATAVLHPPGWLLHLLIIPLVANGLAAQEGVSPDAVEVLHVSQVVTDPQTPGQNFRAFMDRWVKTLFDLHHVLRGPKWEIHSNQADSIRHLLAQVKLMRDVESHAYYKNTLLVSAQHYLENALDPDILEQYRAAFGLSWNLMVDAEEWLGLPHRDNVRQDDVDRVRGRRTGVERIYLLRFQRELSTLREQVKTWDRWLPGNPAKAAAAIALQQTVKDLRQSGMPQDQTALWLKAQFPKLWKGLRKIAQVTDRPKNQSLFRRKGSVDQSA